MHGDQLTSKPPPASICTHCHGRAPDAINCDGAASRAFQMVGDRDGFRIFEAQAAARLAGQLGKGTTASRLRSCGRSVVSSGGWRRLAADLLAANCRSGDGDQPQLLPPTDAAVRRCHTIPELMERMKSVLLLTPTTLPPFAKSELSQAKAAWRCLTPRRHRTTPGQLHQSWGWTLRLSHPELSIGDIQRVGIRRDPCIIKSPASAKTGSLLLIESTRLGVTAETL